MHKTLSVAAFLLSTLALGAQSVANRTAVSHAPAHQIVTFDVPGAVWTSPAGINDAGQVAGSWYDGTNDHGFIRSSTGIIVTFDVTGCVGAAPEAINAGGEVSGYCYDTSDVIH